MLNLLQSFRRSLFGSGADLDRFPRIHARRLTDDRVEIDICIRVWIYRQQGLWVAQGIDLDYVASGTSLDEAKERFSYGLLDTVEANLKEFGSIDHFARPAPQEIWIEFTKALLRDPRPDIKPLGKRTNSHLHNVGNLAFYPLAGPQLAHCAG